MQVVSLAKSPTASEIKRAARMAELRSGTGGTGFTLLKMAPKPIARLVETREIGPEELQAASDIAMAFHSITGSLWIRPQLTERQDKGPGGNEPAAIVDSQRRYRAWADHWSRLRKRGDRTLQIVIAVVIDEVPLKSVELEVGVRHGVAKQATIRGLRDYAVRAGWVKGQLAHRWEMDAYNTFRSWSPEFVSAVARAKRY